MCIYINFSYSAEYDLFIYWHKIKLRKKYITICNCVNYISVSHEYLYEAAILFIEILFLFKITRCELARYDKHLKDLMTYHSILSISTIDIVLFYND